MNFKNDSRKAYYVNAECPYLFPKMRLHSKQKLKRLAKNHLSQDSIFNPHLQNENKITPLNNHVLPNMKLTPKQKSQMQTSLQHLKEKLNKDNTKQLNQNEQPSPRKKIEEIQQQLTKKYQLLENFYKQSTKKFNSSQQFFNKNQQERIKVFNGKTDNQKAMLFLSKSKENPDLNSSQELKDFIYNLNQELEGDTFIAEELQKNATQSEIDKVKNFMEKIGQPSNFQEVQLRNCESLLMKRQDLKIMKHLNKKNIKNNFFSKLYLGYGVSIKHCIEKNYEAYLSSQNDQKGLCSDVFPKDQKRFAQNLNLVITDIQKCEEQYGIYMKHGSERYQKMISNQNQQEINDNIIYMSQDLLEDNFMKEIVQISYEQFLEKKAPNELVDLQKLHDEITAEIYKLQDKQFMNTCQDRKNLQDLVEWISNFLQQLKASQVKISYNNIIDQLQSLFSSVISEISRQIKQQSVERGILNEKIWESFIILMKEMFQKYNYVRIQLEKFSKMKLDILSQNQKELLNVNNLQKSEFIEKIKKYEKENSNLQKEVNYLSKKVSKLGLELKKNIKDFGTLIDEYNQLLFENVQIKNYNEQATLIWQKIEAKDTSEVSYNDILKMKEYIREWNKQHYKENLIKAKDKIENMEKRLDKLKYNDESSDEEAQDQKILGQKDFEYDGVNQNNYCCDISEESEYSSEDDVDKSKQRKQKFKEIIEDKVDSPQVLKIKKSNPRSRMSMKLSISPLQNRLSMAREQANLNMISVVQGKGKSEMIQYKKESEIKSQSPSSVSRGGTLIPIQIIEGGKYFGLKEIGINTISRKKFDKNCDTIGLIEKWNMSTQTGTRVEVKNTLMQTEGIQCEEKKTQTFQKMNRKKIGESIQTNIQLVIKKKKNWKILNNTLSKIKNMEQNKKLMKKCNKIDYSVLQNNDTIQYKKEVEEEEQFSDYTSNYTYLSHSQYNNKQSEKVKQILNEQDSKLSELKQTIAELKNFFETQFSYIKQFTSNLKIDNRVKNQLSKDNVIQNVAFNIANFKEFMKKYDNILENYQYINNLKIFSPGYLEMNNPKVERRGTVFNDANVVRFKRLLTNKAVNLSVTESEEDSSINKESEDDKKVVQRKNSFDILDQKNILQNEKIEELLPNEEVKKFLDSKPSNKLRNLFRQHQQKKAKTVVSQHLLQNKAQQKKNVLGKGGKLEYEEGYQPKNFQQMQKLQRENQKSSTTAMFQNQKMYEKGVKKEIIKTTSVNLGLAHTFFKQLKTQLGHLIIKQIDKEGNVIQKFSPPKNFKANYMTKNNLFKVINQIYNVKIKQCKTNEKNNPLNVVCYDFFLNQFGFKKMAQQKFQQLIESLYKFMEIPCCNYFLRQLQLIEEIIDDKEFDLFIKIITLIEDSSATQTNQHQLLTNFCSDLDFNIPLFQLLPSITLHFNALIGQEKLNDLNSKIQKASSLQQIMNEQQQFKDTMVISFLNALNIICEENFIIRANLLNNLKEIYLAGDVNNDGSISWQEYLMLVRHIQKNTFNITHEMVMFFNNCDLINDETGEKQMTFSQFAIFSRQQHMFSKKQRLNFSISDIQFKNLENLQEQWNTFRLILINRFKKTQCMTEFYAQMIDKIDIFNKNKQDIRISSLSEQTIWYIFRYLSEESQRVLEDFYINQCIPQYLWQINQSRFQFLFSLNQIAFQQS